MAQGYYNLNEAAQALGMSPDELRQMAQKNQIRSFQDRGTLRFRQADIQELSRRRGGTSDPDILALAEPKSGPRTPPAPKSPKPGAPQTPKTPKQGGAAAPEVFEFALDEADDRLDLGGEVKSDSGPRSGSRSGRRMSAGSDSDVKLVSTPASHDSDVKLPSSGPKTPAARKSGLGPKSPVQRKSGLGPASPGPKKTSKLSVDSGVRLVPMDSDSDVKIIGAGGSEEVPIGQQPPPSATDSDIRLEQASEPPQSDERMMLTEEINLDEELKKQEAAQQSKPKSRVKAKSELKFPTQSPFELSESDLNAPTEHSKHPSSSDFELTPEAVRPDSSGSVVLEPSHDDFSVELPDDSAVLSSSGEGELTGPTSGISLSNPVDAGISLEDGSDSGQLDLDMSLEIEATPKPAPREDAVDSSSEFELSLDAEDSGQVLSPAPDKDSSSEFELTLDDSGSDLSLESGSPQAKAGASGDKDIFETDFEVPALQEDSGSEVAAIESSDTDLESSDFDLALDDSDLSVEDESGSQVVALDEESADEAAETLAGEIGEDLEVEVEAEDEEAAEVGTGPVREVVREKLIQPAPWGALPTVFMLPCVVVMLVVGIMGFELIQSSAGFRNAGFLTRTLGELVGMKNLK